MAHTDGRLQVAQYEDAGICLATEVNTLRHKPFDPVVDLTGGLSGLDLMRPDREVTANARRIAACWNACLGLTTEQVEKADVGSLVGTLRNVQQYFDTDAEGIHPFGLRHQVRAALAPFEKGEEG